MDFTKAPSPSQKFAFVRKMQEQIMTGELPNGLILPSDRDLAHSMQVSRTTAAEGIEELIQQGFLKRISQDQVSVVDFRKFGSLDTLVAIMEYQDRALGHQEIQSMLQIRKALEHLTVGLAIDHASEKELEQLGTILDDLISAQTPEAAAECAFFFHHQLACISGNNIIPLLYTSCSKLIYKLWLIYCQQYGKDSLRRNMEKLYDLICQRDTSGADAWIDTYLGWSITGGRQISSPH